jgi:hypothetical protein
MRDVLREYPKYFICNDLRPVARMAAGSERGLFKWHHNQEHPMHARSIPRLAAQLAVAALLAVAAACEHSPTAPGVVASITVTRNPDSLAIGTIRQFTATGMDAYGTIVGIDPVWSVAAGGGAVDQSGVFTAGTAPGTFANTIVASVGSISGSATVTVTSGGAANITVTPTPVTLAAGGTQQFTAVIKDASGNVLTTVPHWSITAGGGTIDANGMFTAGTVAGSYLSTVTASVGALTGTATVNVTGGALASVTVSPDVQQLAVGATQQYTAVGKDANGNIVPFTPIWSVQAKGGTIDASGIFTAGAVAGTFANTVRACSTEACGTGSLSGFATVTVGAGGLASISVTPNPIDVGTGASQQFTAVGRDARGNVVPIPDSRTWSVLAGHAGGTITNAANYTAPATPGVGFDSVRVTSGGISGFARVNVKTASTLATIVVTPNPASIVGGDTQQFTATGLDASGVVVATPGLTWAVVANGGTIGSGTGLFTAGSSTGTYLNTVRATSGGVSGYATVNVTAAPAGALNAIVVTPDPANLAAGATQQFTARGFDATGASVPTPGLTWAVVANGGTIDGTTGLFTAGSAGGTFPNTVRATSGSVSGDASVVVTAAPPPPPSVNLGAAATHGILAGSTVTCASAPGTINADVSVWPGSAITGFQPCVITGARHAADAFAQTAQGDLTTAYLELDAMPCGTTISTNLGGTTLAPGVYCSTSAVGVTGVVTLSGPADAVFVIKAASTLTTAGSVVLAGGAQAKNVYWLVGSSATLGTGSAWQGNIIAFTSITLNDNVTLIGRALARNGAVTLGTNDVITLP